MNPAVTNIAIMLIGMQVAKKLDFEDPNVLFYTRAFYIACQVSTFLIYLFIRLQVDKKNDLTTIKYVEPANPMAGTEARAVVTTVKEYDMQQINSLIKGIFTGLAMMGFMHLYMGYTNPLVMQSVSSLKSALESNMAKIHLYGTPATGDLKRPFKSAPGLMEMLTGAAGGVQTDKASVESAEVSGAGGIKQD
ncbi:phosphate transporter (Pho88) [Lodderomyces elongisporus]|uniref:Inorganic phosphate transporter PHO88 n=1 Tax=Lodderomyces elongisporus (strain ATCC 11503 / CBS 2605 / JCM 1781 / NBRC 1676 / NRRL YB-4239) TaxID=379508 RepID=A5E6X8_LODEL|nr:phosphate transporter (Pho88) [Lodderomyces elongisporus]EDK47186.1 inorganic phosphate transporter PHO88 [Lodderomyces elongisporus NRRL YB-4239]WLF78720.1 phosphate transporter (Pho88) [Lodderomyces elongisporus]